MSFSKIKLNSALMNRKRHMLLGTKKTTTKGVSSRMQKHVSKTVFDTVRSKSAFVSLPCEGLEISLALSSCCWPPAPDNPQLKKLHKENEWVHELQYFALLFADCFDNLHMQFAYDSKKQNLAGLYAKHSEHTLHYYDPGQTSPTVFVGWSSGKPGSLSSGWHTVTPGIWYMYPACWFICRLVTWTAIIARFEQRLLAWVTRKACLLQSHKLSDFHELLNIYKW